MQLVYESQLLVTSFIQLRFMKMSLGEIEKLIIEHNSQKLKDCQAKFIL